MCISGGFRIAYPLNDLDEELRRRGEGGGGIRVKRWVDYMGKMVSDVKSAMKRGRGRKSRKN